MQGQILHVDDRRRSGLILGQDGIRYDFGAGEWRGAVPPRSGGSVDFVAGQGQAREIYPIGIAPQASPVAADNSEIYGWVGVALLVLGFFIPLLPTLGAFIFGVLGAGAARRSGNGTGLLLCRIAWIGAVVSSALVLLLLAAGMTFLWAFAWPIFEALRSADFSSLGNAGDLRV